MAPLITPPIRTSLLTQKGVPFSTENGDIQTTRDWWLYWNRLGDQANLIGLQTSEGAHGDRPVPGGMPDGAIFVESDRGVIYQVQGGDWVYVAGIMYGTISPDQRPRDLGPNDSGFAFTATDPLASDTGRTFVWSGTAWVETSQVLYGTHANRPLPAAAPARCLYAEADRGPLYQNQLGHWVYIAGTMWGTLSPDQRPTDLGIYDAGFHYRSTDLPAREFIWNQTAWVEIMPQTPWAQDIDGAGFRLKNVGQVGIANSLTTMPHGNASSNLVVGEGSGTWGDITAATNTAGLGALVGRLNFANYNLGTTDKRIASVLAFTGASAVNSGTLAFYTWNAGAAAERVRITPTGQLGVGTQSPNAPISIGYTGTDTTVRTWANADIGSFAFYVAQNFPTTSAFQRVLDIVAGGGNAGGNIRFLTQPASGAGVAAMLITPAGNTGLGLVPTYQLQLSVDSAAKPGTSTWAVVSDLRLKQNVEPVKDDSLAILDKLDWIRYEYNGQAQMPQGLKGLGLVAQTLREQMPEAVRSTRTKLNDADAEETDVLAIDYHYVLVHSARAIQQLSAEVKRLGALLNAPQS